MKKTKYSKELKVEVTKKFNQGHTPKKLVEEYNLNSGVQLVYLWNVDNKRLCPKIQDLSNKYILYFFFFYQKNIS